MLKSFMTVTADILAVIPYAMTRQAAGEKPVTIKTFSRGELVATFSQRHGGQGSDNSNMQCTKDLRQ